ncbi:MAG: preprotein translocase subunit SecG [bacterium]|nr:preprotein translocase subunit SecG [bacterium]
MTTILPVIQIAVSLLLIVLILLQERSSATSGIFGGGGGGFYQTRRGAEKAIFIATVVLTIVFAGLAIANLVL